MARWLRTCCAPASIREPLPFSVTIQRFLLAGFSHRTRQTQDAATFGPTLVGVAFEFRLSAPAL